MGEGGAKNWYEQRWFYRLMEMVPGILSWSVLIGPLFLAFFYPDLVAAGVLVFDLYWLFKALEVGWRLWVGYRKIKADAQVNYMEKLKNLTENETAEPKKKWQDLWQVVLLPSYNEGVEIIKPSIESYLRADYPKERIIVVLALEERAGEELNKQRAILRETYKDKFADFLIYTHPDGIAGELKGKSANATWATKQLVKYLAEKKIDFSDVLLSNFDCDTRVHPQYFANMSYKYLIAKNRMQKTYQPIPMFNNNIWDIPLLTRTVAISASFWQIIESTRSYRMVNFSSQAMCLQTLIDIDFWDVTIVSEDSRQYYRAFFYFGGDHEVIPLYTPVYMDAVLSDNFWK
ncbi:MAG TPA: glycosyltransferase family 2 protein, partial [bacterium]|nr:glycosyltransferase family 2 protein [bacterium]